MINTNFVRISHRFRDIASFPLKRAFFLPLKCLHSIPNFKMFPLLNFCTSRFKTQD